MVDRDIIIAKADSIRKHVQKAREKVGIDLKDFLRDADCQDIVLFNIQMAAQNCIDMAAHIISDEGYGVPGSNNEMFYMLEKHGLLDRDLTEKLVKAVGFRNLIVHEYGQLDMTQVYRTAQKDITDLEDYIKAIITKLEI